jgi:hypothetical protein
VRSAQYRYRPCNLSTLHAESIDGSAVGPAVRGAGYATVNNDPGTSAHEVVAEGCCTLTLIGVLPGADQHVLVFSARRFLLSLRQLWHAAQSLARITQEAVEHPAARKSLSEGRAHGHNADLSIAVCACVVCVAGQRRRRWPQHCRVLPPGAERQAAVVEHLACAQPTPGRIVHLSS